MRSFYPWPTFPVHLDRAVARSLSLRFALQELLQGLHLLEVSRQSEIGTLKEVEKFLLLSLENPLSQKSGVLDKLCFYSEILLQRQVSTLEEMRGIILQLCENKKWIPSPDWSLFLDRLHLGFLCFFEALNAPVYAARSDENVLVFLMEHKEPINRYLGPHTLENLFHSFFPEGQDQLRAVLYEGFSRRGFSSFFHKIEPLIAVSFYEGD